MNVNSHDIHVHIKELIEKLAYIQGELFRVQGDIQELEYRHLQLYLDSNEQYRKVLNYYAENQERNSGRKSRNGDVGNPDNIAGD